MTASTLALGIQRKNWELVALCLLLGLAEAAAKLPPETLDQLLDLLETDLSPLRSTYPGEGEGGHRSARGRR